jgi:DEAD/DEAH box helicase domain-containing protein
MEFRKRRSVGVQALTCALENKLKLELQHRSNAPHTESESLSLFLLATAILMNTTVAKNIVYFDLETQKSAEEVGGWNNIVRMGMSIGVTFGTACDGYKIYGEKQINDLLTDLQRADLVVGFNILRFDYEVLHGYTSFDLRQLPTLDMMVELQNTLNHRLSLDSIATATFGVEKTAEGMQAIRWFKDGKLAEIAEYCCYDVKLTKLVHEYGQRHKQLHYHNRFGKKMTVPVSW